MKTRLTLAALAACLFALFLVGCGGEKPPAPDDPNSKANAVRTRPGVSAGPTKKGADQGGQ